MADVLDNTSLTDLFEAIGRLRCYQPHNVDAMLVCDEAERLVALAGKVAKLVRPSFDKTVYQKHYMRRWRAGRFGKIAEAAE